MRQFLPRLKVGASLTQFVVSNARIETTINEIITLAKSVGGWVIFKRVEKNKGVELIEISLTFKISA